MEQMMIILFSAILVDNFVLSKFLGICPFLGVSKNLKTAMGMSAAVVAIMLLASAITWPIQIFLLDPLNIGFLQTLVFILVIAALVQMVETMMKKAMPPLYKALGIYLPLITTNCAVLGVTILNINKAYSFLDAMINSFGAGLGFALALFLFSGVRMRIEKSDIPKALRGLPITLVAASLVSVSFFAFKGLIENIFG
ncbi:MAG: RnfABCDGE type electron transport complex subunit A [Oscillospiraceae bacterium]|jgi:electron transport complex protein RnfA|nr:RnfABCDGE type electron transport complex subunit A [Clostridiales bacterium]MDD4095063.1 RnfABCDGE type electron transport complex subunit A [Oscillospiraceae bacterium]